MTSSETATQGGTSSAESDSNEPRSPEEIEADLEQTRRDLGETVDALSAKLDVKSRAKEQVASTKLRATEQLHTARERASAAAAKGKQAATDDQGGVKPAVPAGAGAAALLAIGLVVVLVRRRRRRPVLAGRRL